MNKNLTVTYVSHACLRMTDSLARVVRPMVFE